jgi:hypothetical protein
VKASIDRIVAEAKVLRQIGIGTIAIMPNDTESYFQQVAALKTHRLPPITRILGGS